MQNIPYTFQEKFRKRIIGGSKNSSEMYYNVGVISS